MAIADQLTLLASTKTAIKQAIEDKGVTVGAAPFGDYAGKIAEIGAVATASWERPTDWPTMPTVLETDQKFVGIHAVFENDGNFCALSAAGAYTVDWGDGTVENFTANAVAYHTFAFSNANLPAATTRGYKCAVVTVTPQAGQNLTVLNLHQKHNQTGLQVYSSGFLDIAIAGQYLTDLRIGVANPSSTTQNIRFEQLERINIVRSNLKQANRLLYGCRRLGEVVNLSTSPDPAGTNFSYMFGNCQALQSIPLLNTAAGTNFTGMFQSCHALQTVPLLNTAAGTNFSYMFYGCYSLQSIPLLNTAAGTNFNNMFQVCPSLANIDATGFKFSFSVAYCKLSAAALNKLYTNLPTVTGQTLTVTGNYGTASDDPSIATAKGWTVTG